MEWQFGEEKAGGGGFTSTSTGKRPTRPLRPAVGHKCAGPKGQVTRRVARPF